MKENKETQRNLLLHHASWKSSVLLKDSEVAVTTVLLLFKILVKMSSIRLTLPDLQINP